MEKKRAVHGGCHAHDLASGPGTLKVQRMLLSERCHAWRGIDPGCFICSGSAFLLLDNLARKRSKKACFPQTIKSIQVSIYVPSFSSVAIRPSSFSPKVKRLLSAAQECNNTGFFWSGYCVCLPGFKLLLERHFRGHHSVVSEREPDVDYVPRGSAWLFLSLPPSFLCNIHHLPLFTRQLVRKGEENRKRALD